MPPKNNTLPQWGNQQSMNLNPLILTNIQSSPYFKNDLFKLKTYHEVIDEIYYKVSHLEPWERGSRQTSGQIGMCGGVRGVGAGGIVSSAYCLLYKLYTLKLTRKQLNGLLTHSDSSYIRALGFLYIRYSQPPQDLWDWYEEYLNDEEEVDSKAGGGNCVTIGQMLMHFLVKLDWHSTRFPRIPVPVMKDIENKVSAWQYAQRQNNPAEGGGGGEETMDDYNTQDDNNEWTANDKKQERFQDERKSSRDRDDDSHRRDKDDDSHRRDRDRHRDQDRDRNRERDRDRGSSRDSHRDRSRNNSRDRSRDHDRHRDRSRDLDFDTALRKERERQTRDHARGSSRDDRHRRSRSRSHERRKRSRSREKRRRSRSRSRDRHRHRSRDRR
nr:pre-mRNA-splicing factor 38B-like isoform X1 [Lytechinus pictus]